MIKSKIVCITVILLIAGLLVYRFSQPTFNNLKYSTWIWDASILDKKNVIDEIKNYNINRIYLFINVNEPSSILHNRIKLLVDNNIEVELLIGDPYYLSQNSDKVLYELYEYIEAYNNSVDEVYKVNTIHVDVEPHANKNWKKRQVKLTLQYQIFLEKFVDLFENYRINADIPFWYDEVVYNNNYGEGLLFDFVLDMVDGITIMAYNDDPEFIKTVIEYEMSKTDKIEIAVEYGDIKEINTTFYDEGSEFMFEQIENLYDTFNKCQYAIHEIIVLE